MSITKNKPSRTSSYINFSNNVRLSSDYFMCHNGLHLINIKCSGHLGSFQNTSTAQASRPNDSNNLFDPDGLRPSLDCSSSHSSRVIHN